MGEKLRDFSDLKGQTIVGIEGPKQYSDHITFTLANGDSYVLHHYQDCCESVLIEDVDGDWQDLIGLPLVLAEESTSDDFDDRYADLQQWTFYRLATQRGYVIIRWYGESNGYYGVGVDFSSWDTPTDFDYSIGDETEPN